MLRTILRMYQMYVSYLFLIKPCIPLYSVLGNHGQRYFNHLRCRKVIHNFHCSCFIHTIYLRTGVRWVIVPLTSAQEIIQFNPWNLLYGTGWDQWASSYQTEQPKRGPGTYHRFWSMTVTP